MQEEFKPAAIYSPISIGNWIISLILTMIALDNIIMLFVWAFSNGTYPKNANCAKASLILILVWIILGIIFGGYFMRMFYGYYPTY